MTWQNGEKALTGFLWGVNEMTEVAPRTVPGNSKSQKSWPSLNFPFLGSGLSLLAASILFDLGGRSIEGPRKRLLHNKIRHSAEQLASADHDSLDTYCSQFFTQWNDNLMELTHLNKLMYRRCSATWAQRVLVPSPPHRPLLPQNSYYMASRSCHAWRAQTGITQRNGSEV